MAEEIGVRFVAEGAGAYASALEGAQKAELNLGQSAKTAAQGVELLDQATRKALRMEGLTEKIGLQERQLSILQKELSQTAAKYGEASTQAQKKALALDRLTSQMAQAGRELDALKNATTTAASGFDDAARKTSAFGEVMTGVFRRVGELAVNAMLEAAEAVGRFALDSISAAGDFEAGMNRFGAVTGDAVADAGMSLEQFSDLFLQMGADTQFSAAQAQEAAINLAKGGIEPAEIAAGALRETLSLAAAGELELANAAEITAKQLGIWADRGTTAADVANFLSQAANASTVGVEDLALGMAQAGGQAKVAGLSFKETVQTMALLAPGFSSASDAGTSFKTFLQRLQPTTKAARAEFTELGLLTKEGASRFYDANGAFIGMNNAAGLLQNGLSKLNDAQRSAALTTMFGTDAFRAAAIIAEQGAAGFTAMGTSMAGVGTAAEQAALRNQGFNFALESLRGSLETFGIVAGTLVLPALTALINQALIPGVNAVTAFSQAFADGTTPINALIAYVNDFGVPALAGLTAALTAYALVQAGQALPAILASIPAIVAQTTAFIANAAAVALAVAPYALIAAAVAGVVYAYRDLEGKIDASNQKLLEGQGFWQRSTAALDAYKQSSEATQKATAAHAATQDILRQKIAEETEALGRAMLHGQLRQGEYETRIAKIKELGLQLDTSSGAMQREVDALMRSEAAANTATAKLAELGSSHEKMTPQIELTVEALGELDKALEQTYTEGGKAVEAFAQTHIKYVDGVEQRQEAFYAKLEKLEQEFWAASTDEQRAAIQEKIADLTDGYAQEEKEQALSYSRQQQAQREHLGQMLIDYATNQRDRGNMTQQEAEALSTAIAKEYGIAADNASLVFLRMTGEIDKWAANNDTQMTGVSGAVTSMSSTSSGAIDTLIGKLHDQEQSAIDTTRAMEDYEGEYVAKAVDNFVETRGRAADLASQVDRIPRNVTIHVDVIAKPLPKEITPSSPTPFEMGIRGINAATQELADQGMPQMGMAMREAGETGETVLQSLAEGMQKLGDVISGVSASIADDLEEQFTAAVDAVNAQIDALEDRQLEMQRRGVGGKATQAGLDRQFRRWASDFADESKKAFAKAQADYAKALRGTDVAAMEQAGIEVRVRQQQLAAEEDLVKQAQTDRGRIQEEAKAIQDEELRAQFLGERLRMLQEEYDLRLEIARAADPREAFAREAELSDLIREQNYARQALALDIAAGAKELAQSTEDQQQAVGDLANVVGQMVDNLRERENFLQQIQRNAVKTARGTVSHFMKDGKRINLTAEQFTNYMAELTRLQGALGVVGQYGANLDVMAGGGTALPFPDMFGQSTPELPSEQVSTKEPAGSPWMIQYPTQGWGLNSRLLPDGRMLPMGYTFAGGAFTPPTLGQVEGEGKLTGAQYKMYLNKWIGEHRALYLLASPPSFRRGVTNFGGGLAQVHAGELLVNMAAGSSVIPRQRYESVAMPMPQPYVVEKNTTTTGATMNYSPTYNGASGNPALDYYAMRTFAGAA